MPAISRRARGTVQIDRSGASTSSAEYPKAKYRLISGTLPAAAMTFGLFTFMYSAIGGFDAPAEPAPLPELTKFTPEISDPAVRPRDDRSLAPIPVASPPPSPPSYSADDVDVFIPAAKEIGRAPQRLDNEMIRPAVLGKIEVDKPAQPITAPNVVYPRRLLEQGIEGRCDVRFDLSARGDPFNIKADCTHSGFERSAKRAVSGTRFSPKLVRGQAVERTNVVYPITYALED